MRKVSAQTANPGDQLARDIFTEKGNILLRAGRELNKPLLDRLISLGINTLYIEDKLTEDIRPFETLNEEARLKTLKSIRRSLVEVSRKPELETLAVTPQLGTIFKTIFKQIMEQIAKRETMLINLSDLYVKGDYLYHQSINVTALSILMGLSKGYNEKQLEDLGVGALLADVGMVKLPQALLNKETELTKEEIELIRKHPEDGYMFLREQEDISPVSALCAWQHHERYDGTGYPAGLKGNEIHQFAQIIAIADVYSALTSTRKYRKRFNPGEALEYMYASGDSHFSLDLLQMFTSKVAIYPIASTVQLNTGETAVVTEIQPSLITRPLVRIISEANGSPVIRRRDLDLSKHLNVTIVQVL